MKAAGSKPERLKKIDQCAGLVAAALRRGGQPKSLSRQTKGIISHWFRKLLDGEAEIYPGAKKMATWAGCEERTARENAAILRNWEVLIPRAYPKGGRRATRYVVDTERLFRVLVDQGANPSRKLRGLLQECYPAQRRVTQIPDPKPPIENPAFSGQETVEDQEVDRRLCSLDACTEKPCSFACKKPCESADGIHTLICKPCANVEHGFELAEPEFDTPAGTSTLLPAPAADVGADAEKMDPAETERSGSTGPNSFSEEKNVFEERVSATTEEPARATTSEPSACGAGWDEGRPAATDVPDPAREIDTSNDASVLLDHLRRHGPASYGAAASDLNWTPTRSWQADVELKRRNAIRYEQGKMVPLNDPP